MRGIGTFIAALILAIVAVVIASAVLFGSFQEARAQLSNLLGLPSPRVSLNPAFEDSIIYSLDRCTIGCASLESGGFKGNLQNVKFGRCEQLPNSIKEGSSKAICRENSLLFPVEYYDGIRNAETVERVYFVGQGLFEVVFISDNVDLGVIDALRLPDAVILPDSIAVSVKESGTNVEQFTLKRFLNPLYIFTYDGVRGGSTSTEVRTEVSKLEEGLDQYVVVTPPSVELTFVAGKDYHLVITDNGNTNNPDRVDALVHISFVSGVTDTVKLNFDTNGFDDEVQFTIDEPRTVDFEGGKITMVVKSVNRPFGAAGSATISMTFSSN